MQITKKSLIDNTNMQESKSQERTQTQWNHYEVTRVNGKNPEAIEQNKLYLAQIQMDHEINRIQNGITYKLNFNRS